MEAQRGRKRADLARNTMALATVLFPRRGYKNGPSLLGANTMPSSRVCGPRWWPQPARGDHAAGLGSQVAPSGRESVMQSGRPAGCKFIHWIPAPGQRKVFSTLVARPLLFLSRIFHDLFPLLHACPPIKSGPHSHVISGPTDWPTQMHTRALIQYSLHTVHCPPKIRLQICLQRCAEM